MRTRSNLKAIFGVAALLETGLFMSSAGAATFVYVGNADSQDVSVLELKSNGDLTPVETAAVPGPAKPGGSLPLAVSPDKKRLFVGLRNEPYSVVTFAIDASPRVSHSFISNGVGRRLRLAVGDWTVAFGTRRKSS